MKKRDFRVLAAVGAVGVWLVPAVAGAQQASGSMPVVQPQPGREVDQLNAALQRLALNPQSVDALIAAGSAALELGDIDAAIGFFGRADELSPGNPRAKMGMAAGFMRSERPIEALRLFAEAEGAGVSSDQLAGDRGLAFDLVGDNAHAQEQYRNALKRRADNEVARRLAVSLAISGKRNEFEEALLPMLKQRDLAAYRSRALGLAILGDDEEALRIVKAVMPESMVKGLEPYLRYMPRLTKAQQAAAANFGRFPLAADIGRDDPRLAQYSQSSKPTVRRADARLAPQGAPLGAPSATSRPAVSAAPAPPAAQPRQVISQPVAQPLPPPPVQPQVQVQPQPQAQPPVRVVQPQPQLVPPQPQAPNRAASPPTPAQGSTSNLARVTSQQNAPVETRGSVAGAFADFSLPQASPAARTVGGVDITAIKPKREVVQPPPPKAPSRVWVQVATGQDLGALKFDWRRLSRKAPELLGKFKPHTTPWGQANRLLAGPYANENAAREAMKALKAAGIETFSFTSPEGQDVRELQ